MPSRDFDVIDQKIVDVLVAEPRASSRAIAEMVGVAEATARNRLRKLMSSGAVDIRGNAHPLALPNGTLCFVHIFYAGVDGVDLADPLLAQAIWIGTSLTRQVLLAEFVLESVADLGTVLDRLGTQPGVSWVHGGTAYRLHAGPGSPGRSNANPGHWGSRMNRNVDSVDTTILRRLSRDGRASYTDLSTDAGLSVQATRRRVLSLIEDGILNFSTYLADDSTSLRYALVGCAVRGDSTTTFLADITQLPGVSYVAEVTAPLPFIVEVIAENESELINLVAQVRSRPDVVASEVEPFTLAHDTKSWGLGHVVSLA